MVGFLQRLIGLRDEGGGPLDALLAVGDLLGELADPMRLGFGWQRESLRTSAIGPDRMTNARMRAIWLKWCKLLGIRQNGLKRFWGGVLVRR